MSSLTLYRANGGVSSFIPHTLLTELSIPFTSVVMKVGPDGMESVCGSITNAEYRAIHHMGYVPALNVDGEIITEWPAVVTYIASLAPPERKLLGDGDLERARVVEWVAWLSGTIHAQGVAMVFRPRRFSDDPGQDAALGARGKAAVQKGLQRIEEKLSGRVYPVGDHETVVDFILPLFWFWAAKMGISNLKESFPSLATLVERMEQKESVKKVTTLEGISLSSD